MTMKAWRQFGGLFDQTKRHIDLIRQVVEVRCQRRAALAAIPTHNPPGYGNGRSPIEVSFPCQRERKRQMLRPGRRSSVGNRYNGSRPRFVGLP